eukprot:5693960-Prymnesium_polylepis.1
MPLARRVAAPVASSPRAADAHAPATASTLTGGRRATFIRPGAMSASATNRSSERSSSTPLPYAALTRGATNLP